MLGFFSWLVCPILLAQTIEEREVLMVEGEQNGPSSGIITNMLQVINQLEEEQDPSFSIHYKELIEVSPRNGRNAIALTFNDIEIKGLKEPLFFSFKREFVPVALSTQVGIYRNGQKIREVRFLDILITKGQTKKQWIVLEGEEKDCEIKVLGVSFLYNEVRYLQVFLKVELIEEYIRTFYDLEEIELAISEVEADLIMPNRFTDIEGELNEIKERFRGILDRIFWNDLDYPTAEQRNGFQIEVLKDKVLRYLSNIQNRFDLAKAHQDVLFVEMGLKHYQKKKHEKAKRQFLLAIDFNPKNPKANYMLGLIAYEKMIYDEAEKRVKMLLNDVAEFKEEFQFQVVSLGQQIFEANLNQGKMAYQKKDMDKAKIFFQKAADFCLHTLGIDCMDVEEWLEKIKIKTKANE